MAEFIFFLMLISPIILMIWLTLARRSAQAKVAERAGPEDNLRGFDTVEEEEAGPDGLVSGRQHFAEASLIEPDHTGGEPAGIRSIQGKR